MHVVLDLYGRYALSYNISPTETAVSAIEVFKRAFKVEPDAHPLIHTDRIVHTGYKMLENTDLKFSVFQHFFILVSY